MYLPVIPSASAAGLEGRGNVLCSRDMEAGLKEKHHIAACPLGGEWSLERGQQAQIHSQ